MLQSTFSHLLLLFLSLRGEEGHIEHAPFFETRVRLRFISKDFPSAAPLKEAARETRGNVCVDSREAMLCFLKGILKCKSQRTARCCCLTYS